MRRTENGENFPISDVSDRHLGRKTVFGGPPKPTGQRPVLPGARAAVDASLCEAQEMR